MYKKSNLIGKVYRICVESQVILGNTTLETENKGDFNEFIPTHLSFKMALVKFLIGF